MHALVQPDLPSHRPTERFCLFALNLILGRNGSGPLGKSVPSYLVGKYLDYENTVEASVKKVRITAGAAI